MNKKVSLFLYTIIITAASCNPCGKLDCNTDNHNGFFKFINKANGSDLLFGANRIFDFSKIKCYSVNGTDTVGYQITKQQASSNFNDSLVVIRFYPVTANPVYLQLNQTDTDTLENTFKTYTSKCCGIITEINQIKYNNTTVFKGGYSIIEIKK